MVLLSPSLNGHLPCSCCCHACSTASGQPCCLCLGFVVCLHGRFAHASQKGLTESAAQPYTVTVSTGGEGDEDEEEEEEDEEEGDEEEDEGEGEEEMRGKGFTCRRLQERKQNVQRPQLRKRGRLIVQR